jgi:sarcosine dehydrogenase
MFACPAANLPSIFGRSLPSSRLATKRTGLLKSFAPVAAQKTRQFSSHAELPSEADVVVIGGGSVGASTLYHLQKAGVNAIMLERHELTAGTTWHSAGMLWRLRPSDADIELNAYTRDMCKQLETETEINSWSENGGLFVANNATRFDEYKRFSETGKYFGIESHVLSPADVKQVHPLLNVEDVVGGIYSPGDGTIDPTSIVNAYAKAARKMGARIFEKTGVSAIESEDYITAGGAQARRITAVRTACGARIATKTVVNACGAWANSVAEMVGVQIPLEAMRHAMILTEPIEGYHSGLPNVRDHDLSIYLKTQGDSVCLGGYEQNPEFWRDVDPEFAFGLFELDWETFGQNLEGHMQRLPIVESTGIKSTVCGPESFTPDHKPLVGPHPGVRGFYHCCGFNSMGMMLGGGIGRELTKWILTGSPEVDLFGFDVARFHPDTVASRKWVKDRTHESYAKTYAIVFPHDEALAGRGARKSAIHDELVKRGCIHQARHGFERPGWFERSITPPSQVPMPYDYYGAYAEGAWRLGEEDHPDVPANENDQYLEFIEGDLTFNWPKSHATIAEECRAAREGVALLDHSYFGKFYIQGPEAFEAVQYLCGADMEGKAFGSVTYTPLCNVRGGVEADLTVTRLQDSSAPGGQKYYIAAGGNTVTKDFDWIRNVLDDKGFNATIEDHSASLTIWSVQGPHSRALLQSLVTSGGPDVFSNEAFPFSAAREVEIAGHKILALRLTFVGELGFELHIPAEVAPAVYRAVREAGELYEKEHKVPVRDAGYRAIDSMSAEKNLRHWHADLTNVDTPLQAGIGFTVLPKLKRTGDDAPDFLGRAALEEQRAAGLRRKLICLVVDDSNVMLHGAESIWRDGSCVGYVKSTAFGHTIGKSIAYGYITCPESVPKITNKWLEAGIYQIGDKGSKHPATLSLKAPFDPTNSRVKGQYASVAAEKVPMSGQTDIAGVRAPAAL